MHSCSNFSYNVRITIFLARLFSPSDNRHLDNHPLIGQYLTHRYFLVLTETRWMNTNCVAYVHFHHRPISLGGVSVRSMATLHHYRPSLRTLSHPEVFLLDLPFRRRDRRPRRPLCHIDPRRTRLVKLTDIFQIRSPFKVRRDSYEYEEYSPPYKLESSDITFHVLTHVQYIIRSSCVRFLLLEYSSYNHVFFFLFFPFMDINFTPRFVREFFV